MYLMPDIGSDPKGVRRQNEPVARLNLQLDDFQEVQRFRFSREGAETHQIAVGILGVTPIARLFSLPQQTLCLLGFREVVVRELVASVQLVSGEKFGRPAFWKIDGDHISQISKDGLMLLSVDLETQDATGRAEVVARLVINRVSGESSLFVFLGNGFVRLAYGFSNAFSREALRSEILDHRLHETFGSDGAVCLRIRSVGQASAGDAVRDDHDIEIVLRLPRYPCVFVRLVGLSQMGLGQTEHVG